MKGSETEYQNINFRMEKAIKRELDEVLSEIGLNTSTAFNMFARLVIRERGVPFPVTAKTDDIIINEARKALDEIRNNAASNGTAGISMKEIALYRKEKRESKSVVE